MTVNNKATVENIIDIDILDTIGGAPNTFRDKMPGERPRKRENLFLALRRPYYHNLTINYNDMITEQNVRI